MSAQHTPGPWTAERDPCHFDTLSEVYGGEAQGKSRQLMVSVGGLAEWQEQEANARLISAAPDLLAAMDELIAVSSRAVRLSSEHDNFKLYAMEPMHHAIEVARAAVSLARGQA